MRRAAATLSARTRALPAPLRRNLLVARRCPSSPPARFLAKHAAIFYPRDVTMNYKRASGEYVKLHEAALSGAGGGSGGGSARGKQFAIPADPKKLLDLD